MPSIPSPKPVISPTIIARCDVPAQTLTDHSGATVGKTVGISITVECPVNRTAEGHAQLDRAVAEIRRQLDVLGPPVQR